MAGHVTFDIDLALEPVRESLPQVPGKRRGVDQRLENQASPPVAGFVVPDTTIALTRLRAMTMRWTSEGPS